MRSYQRYFLDAQALNRENDSRDSERPSSSPFSTRWPRRVRRRIDRHRGTGRLIRNDVQRQQLRARLIEAGYGNVNIHEAVEPDLLGGLVVRIGARLYDTSLKSRLQRLQYAMKGAA